MAAGGVRVDTKNGGSVSVSNVIDEKEFEDEGAGVGNIIFVSDTAVTLTIQGNDPHPNISYRPKASLNGRSFDLGSEREDVEVANRVATLSKPGYYGVNVRFGSDFSADTVAEFVVQILGNGSNSEGDTKTERAPADVQEAVNAEPTASNVRVDGHEKSFEAYNINGNNFFKLRDLAAVLSGTRKQFEVSWDSDKNAINLITGKAYTSVGGELALSDKPVTQKASSTASVIYIDGKQTQLTAYNINGNNYFKLRDIAKAINFGVTWDGTSNRIGMDSAAEYVEPEAEKSPSGETVPAAKGFHVKINNDTQTGTVPEFQLELWSVKEDNLLGAVQANASHYDRNIGVYNLTFDYEGYKAGDELALVLREADSSIAYISFTFTKINEAGDLERSTYKVEKGTHVKLKIEEKTYYPGEDETVTATTLIGSDLYPIEGFLKKGK
ncbi:hypothetical protein DLM86_23950 [Paenibacillus flagellatus]|uniref:Copper amine oxidase-like N-terminal domain-containing protein n=2 Tax=Paenibacillus flagellatus TaxID=2211139 RepID=A0A2V5K264_9BACL|nr:hypothetical protein DLM86_23950 [Paenibacillus flagellatus]